MNDQTPIERRSPKERLAEPLSQRAREHIEEAIRGLRYGTVTVIVHDGVIVQVERTERTRFGKGS